MGGMDLKRKLEFQFVKKLGDLDKRDKKEESTEVQTERLERKKEDEYLIVGGNSAVFTLRGPAVAPN